MAAQPVLTILLVVVQLAKKTGGTLTDCVINNVQINIIKTILHKYVQVVFIVAKPAEIGNKVIV